MSAKFARELISNLNRRIDSTELSDSQIRVALIMYRNAIQETMLAMGHELE